MGIRSKLDFFRLILNIEYNYGCTNVKIFINLTDSGFQIRFHYFFLNSPEGPLSRRVFQAPIRGACSGSPIGPGLRHPNSLT
jgi:hypothetical protein